MSDEPIHEQLREQAEREGLLEVDSSELEASGTPIAEAISRQLLPVRILVATVALDVLGVLAFLFVNVIVAIAIFVFSGTLFAVWALARTREAARAGIEADERRRAASGEGVDDA